MPYQHSEAELIELAIASVLTTLRERVRDPSLAFERTAHGLSVDLPRAPTADYFFRVVCHPDGSKSVAAISTVSGQYGHVLSISSALGLRLWQLCHRPTRILEIQDGGEIVRVLQVGSDGGGSRGRLFRETSNSLSSRREHVYRAPPVAPEPDPP